MCATTPDPALKGSSQLVLELCEDWSGRWLEQKWRQQSVGSMGSGERDTPRVARNPCSSEGIRGLKQAVSRASVHI